MSKIFQLEGGQYEHPNEYKLVSTDRGTTILQPEFGTVIIEGDVIEASTHNNIQKNGVLASKVNVTMESTDTVLVPTDMTIELDLFNELKIMLLFETGTTLPSNSFIKLKETNVPIANVNDYVVNANTPLLFLYFDSKFYAYKAGEGAKSLGDLSDVTLTTPTNGQALVYNGTNFVNGLQLGLVHSVIPVHSVIRVKSVEDFSMYYYTDYYTCDIEGIADFGMHNELKLQVKITATNAYDYPKIKMAGNEYQIMRFDGGQLTQVLTGQLKADNIYNLSFNGTLFVLSSGMIAEEEVKALLDTTDFQATETTNGVSKIATQSEVNAGLEDTKIVTSKKLKALHTAGVSKTQYGYQKSPSGVIMQWGMSGKNVPNVTFPIAFPTACVTVQITRGGGTVSNSTGSAAVGASVLITMSNNGFTFDSVTQSPDKSLIHYLAIGY